MIQGSTDFECVLNRIGATSTLAILLSSTAVPVESAIGAGGATQNVVAHDGLVFLCPFPCVIVPAALIIMCALRKFVIVCLHVMLHTLVHIVVFNAP